MSAAHFGMLPGLALQLATHVEAYAAAMRALGEAPLDTARLPAATASLAPIRELAGAVPALWSEWGCFVVAHSAFSLGRLSDPEAPELAARLLELDACAEALMRKAVRWAVLEQHQFPVSIDVAQAFIEWEAARKVVFELRQAAASHANPGPETREWRALWEGRSAELLAGALAVLREQGDAI